MRRLHGAKTSLAIAMTTPLSADSPERPPQGGEFVLILAQEFRFGLVGHKPVESGGGVLINEPLEGYLQAFGIRCKLVEGLVQGQRHFWVELLEDKTIVDAVASQFRTPDGRKMPAVYVGKRPEWYLTRRPEFSTPWKESN